MSDLPPGFVLDSAPQQGPIYGPPPKAPSAMEERRMDLSENNANRQAKNQERQLALAERRFQYQIERDNEKTGAAGAKPADAKAAAKAANLESLTKQINRVQSLFNSSQDKNTIPLLGSLTEYLPTQANAQFDSAGAGLAEQGLAAFRVPGVGSQSDTELRQFIEANKPSSWSMDSANKERLRTLRNRVDETRKSLGLPPAQWEGLPDEDYGYDGEGLVGRVTDDSPARKEFSQKHPDDIQAIMAKYGAQ